MEYSKLSSVILTVLIVILASYFYDLGIELTSIFSANETIKHYILGCGLPWFSISKKVVNSVGSLKSDSLFTPTELEQFTGENNNNIYLSILGKVFDVTKGKKFYGVGENYHEFAGRDASKAFVTGDFTEQGLVDDISDLSLNELGDLQEWVHKYEKDYIYKGKLIGRFYDETGNPTKFLEEINDKLSLLSVNKNTDEFYKKKYPPCNAEWNADTGSRVWCSRLSGGIQRDWIGFPRKFHQPGSDVTRCACINLKNERIEPGNFEIYKNCDSKSISCYLTKL